MIATFTLLSLFIIGAYTSPLPQTGTGNPPDNSRLVCGFHWINTLTNTEGNEFLQNSSPYSPSSATLGDFPTAGQFEIVSGGLIELTSQIPELGYNHALVDSSSGAVSFEMGDAPPQGSGSFDFDEGDMLTFVTSDGVMANGFAMCNGQLFVDIPNVGMPDGCSSVTIAKNETACQPQ